MKYFLFCCLMTITALVLASCTNVEVNRDFKGLWLEDANQKPVANIHDEIYGYYLFNVFPVFTGSANSEGGMNMFQDTVKVENAVALLTKTASGLGATKVTNLTSRTANSGLNTLWIFWYKDVQVSGNAIK